jgi:hypothetical protein
MRGRLRSLVLVLTTFVVASTPPAMAAEPDASAPPVPPPSSPPPPASPAIPPTGNAPPPICPPPPPAYCLPPPGDAPPPRPRRVRRPGPFFIMPFVGIHSYQHAEAFNTDPGLRLGSFVGGRLNDVFSLNGEVRFDVTNPGDLPAGTNVNEYAYSATFSPLIQVPSGGPEFVLGPKVGAVFISQEFSNGTARAHTSAVGVVFGANAGVFVPVSASTSLGVLLSFELAKPVFSCVRDTFGDSTCGTVDPPTSVVLGLTGAVLF